MRSLERVLGQLAFTITFTSPAETVATMADLFFSRAIMDSSSLMPVTDAASAKPQGIYDMAVRGGGCANVPSTLDCLRECPYEVYKAAADSVPPYTSARGVDLSYRTRRDPNDIFYPVLGEVATGRGDFAKVPAII